MAERHTLDTSALIAYMADEPGADQVQRLLEGAGRFALAVAVLVTLGLGVYPLPFLDLARAAAAWL